MFEFFRTPNIDKGVSDFLATPTAVLLDVRSADEYKQGHIPGSVNIDVGKIDAATTVIEDKRTPVFVYCLSGGRSGMAVDSLKKMGYTDVKNIGGIRAYSGKLEQGA